VFFGEALVSLDAIRADPDDPGSGVLVVLARVAEGAGFGGAAGRVVLGIEVENHRRSSELRERYLLPVLVGKGKIRGGLTDFDHVSTSRQVAPEGKPLAVDRWPKNTRRTT